MLEGSAGNTVEITQRRKGTGGDEGKQVWVIHPAGDVSKQLKSLPLCTFALNRRPNPTLPKPPQTG
jgi:hypothetical protein